MQLKSHAVLMHGYLIFFKLYNLQEVQLSIKTSLVSLNLPAG